MVNKRQQKIDEITAFLKEKGRKAKFKEVFSHLFSKYAVSLTAFRSCLNTLKLAGKIEYDSVHVIGNEGDTVITLKS